MATVPGAIRLGGAGMTSAVDAGTAATADRAPPGRATAARARVRSPAVARAPVRSPAVALADDTRRSQRRGKPTAARAALPARVALPARAALPGVARLTAAGNHSPRPTAAGTRSLRALVTDAADPAGLAAPPDTAQWAPRAARAADRARAADQA